MRPGAGPPVVDAAGGRPGPGGGLREEGKRDPDRELEAGCWQRLKEIFLAALELPATERPLFVRERCGADADLASRILALLAEDQEGSSPLDRPLAQRLATLLPPELPGLATPAERLPDPPRRLGPYRLLQRVGRGGQSTVYLGERDDGQYQQRVAIKVLDRPPGEPAASLEGPILATLSHGGIARLLDAGSTPEGLAYFVMEWVDGHAIDIYCHRHSRGVRRRLEVFLEVCVAVQHAHQSLVIHSDLKPANILVTLEGRAKLLDFGIARLQQKALFSGGEASRSRSLTPAYASPEQHRGESLTAASDVFSLGVILFQLLTGTLPFGAAGPAPPDARPDRPSAWIVRLGKVPTARPAGPTEVRRWRRRLRGDLDAILLKALAPEPSERYGSVADLAGDLRRHLERRPVEARDSSWLYRSGRWLRRRRLTAALAVVLLTGFAGFGVQHLRLSQTLQRLGEERIKVEGMNRFLEQLISVARPGVGQGEELTVRQVVDQASRSLAVELAHLPATQASLLESVGQTYKALDLLDRSEASLESALRIRRSHFGPRHAAVADSLGGLAHLQLARGDLARAEALARQALDLRRDLLGERHLKVAESLHDLGETLAAQGRLGEAEDLLLEALDLRRRLVGPEHRSILESYFELALLHRDRGDFRTAISFYGQALPLARKLLGQGHLETVLLASDYGYSLREVGEGRAAEGLFREAEEGFRRLLGEDHPWVHIARSNLARLLRDDGRFAEAESLLEKVLESRRRTQPVGDVRIAYALRDFGQLRLQEGRPAAAGELLGEAVSILRASLPPEDWRISQAESALGECLTRLGRYDEAEPLLGESYEALERRWGPESRRSLRARERLAAFYRATGRPAAPGGSAAPPRSSPRETLAEGAPSPGARSAARTAEGAAGQGAER